MNEPNRILGIVAAFVVIVLIVIAFFVWPRNSSVEPKPTPTPTQTIPITPDLEGKGA
jgi:hypothetical protein